MKNVLNSLLLFAVCACLMAVSEGNTLGAARELWVDSKVGNDANKGSSKDPVRGLSRAIALANSANPAVPVHIKLRPGVYPVAPATTITRDHVQIEGLSRPILSNSGYLEGFANDVIIMPAGFGCHYPCIINPLLMVHANDVQFSGLRFINPHRMESDYFESAGSDYMVMVMFEGQYDMATPRLFTQNVVRYCEFDTCFIGVNVNYASAKLETNKVESCFVPFWFGPGPGGSKIDVTRNVMRSTWENAITATGTPEFWTVPTQPCSLELNISENIFADGKLLFGIELYIRDIFPLLDQTGSLKGTIRNNTFVGNKLGGIGIVDGVHESDFPCDVPYAPTSVQVSLGQNTYLGNGVTTAEPWEHTALIAFQGFAPYFEPWIDGCFINHCTVEIADPANELADLVGGTRRFQYRIRPGDNNHFTVNGVAYTSGVPGTYPP